VSAPPPRRLRELELRPRRALGQNFLIDPNILGVIERAADLQGRDVALEIGGGLGVLSARLAAVAAHVHVVEVDRRLEQPLRNALAEHDNYTLHIADALRLDFATELRPPPTKVVANLPYAIAATVLLRTVFELETVTSWVAMVQREVGERLAAGPGSRAYGLPSVLAQLSCEVRVLRAVSRTVFDPVPRVDSVLVGLRRRAPAPPAGLRTFASGAFAHRRKALARSLVLAGAVESVGPVREALVALGHPADTRAERLTPEQMRALWERVG
jgi:16S rRNA (adenine1518-N6/adenine1519-N6)-dimethyltransferase